MLQKARLQQTCLEGPEGETYKTAACYSPHLSLKACLPLTLSLDKVVTAEL